jgi:hypothetical protein
MSVMERRLQLLLDQDRYDRVASVAERDGKSVAAVIRAAIDVAYPSLDEERNAALRRFLDSVAENPDTGPTEDWPDIKAAMEDELDQKLSKWG